MKVGLATGCFDLFHAGHRHFLREALKQCQYLVVAVNHDGYCSRVKGPDRPFDPLPRRMGRVHAFIEQNGGHGAVIPFMGNDLALLAEIRPDVVFRSYEYAGCDSKGIEVRYIDKIPGVSTTLIAQQRRNTL